ncbi:hypothetical protein MC885_013474 [Smutsia gigantea]|nr:hypothetical protein MC885_013474 [Smutsia gigantea]
MRVQKIHLANHLLLLLSGLLALSHGQLHPEPHGQGHTNSPHQEALRTDALCLLSLFPSALWEKPSVLSMTPRQDFYAAEGAAVKVSKMLQGTAP